MNAAVSAVTTHGFTMGYFTFGNGKTPFVMLPGISIKPITTFAPAVANAYKDLAGDFTFYVFNTRADLPDNYSLYDAARDTAAVLDELGISRACVFGVSMGGMIAQVLAVNRPDLVGKLVLGSSASRKRSSSALFHSLKTAICRRLRRTLHKQYTPRASLKPTRRLSF